MALPTARLPTFTLQRLPKSSWRDVQYRGDPLLRPIASFEIGLLVRMATVLFARVLPACASVCPARLACLHWHRGPQLNNPNAAGFVSRLLVLRRCACWWRSACG